MWNALKYGIWNVAQPEAGSVNALVAAGYAPLAAMVLASRGLGTEKEAAAYLDCNAPLEDPFRMKDSAASSPVSTPMVSPLYPA